MNRIFGIIQIYWLYLYETDFKDYELLRFSVQRSIFERWRMLKYQLLEENNQTHFEKFQNLHTKFREHYIEIMAHLNLLRQNDGLDSIRIQANTFLKSTAYKRNIFKNIKDEFRYEKTAKY